MKSWIRAKNVCPIKKYFLLINPKKESKEYVDDRSNSEHGLQSYFYSDFVDIELWNQSLRFG